MSEIELLFEKREKANLGGGQEKILLQHSMNKMTARERISYLLDYNSFIEIGGMIGGNSSGVITGYGTVLDKLVYLYSGRWYDYCTRCQKNMQHNGNGT